MSVALPIPLEAPVTMIDFLKIVIILIAWNKIKAAYLLLP
jgi:hypothetical protein